MMRLGRSVRLSGRGLVVAVVLASKLAGQQDDPNAVRISTADVGRFLSLYSKLETARSYRDSAVVLFNDYYLAGSPGLRGFIRQRIGIPFELLDQMNAQHAYYNHLPVSLARISTHEDEIRAAFRRFKVLDPKARFTDVYIVVGRMNSGGTTEPNQILIGAEMYGRDSAAPVSRLDAWHKAVMRDDSKLAAIVVHELMHINQPEVRNATLLQASLLECGADFVAELVTHDNINSHVHAWAGPREADLWREFRARMGGHDATGWLYGGESADGRPADLGYYMGYRIAKSYYDRASDKTRAIQEILAVSDAEQFLRDSGYDPGRSAP